MRDFQEKKSWKHIFRTKIFLLILGVVIVFFALNVFNLMSSTWETVKNKRVAEDKVLQLLEKKEKLTNDIQKLETEKGKEMIFREDFGFSKPGEEMILITEDVQKNNDLERKENEESFFKKLFK